MSGTSVNLTGLSAGTTYTFKAYSDSGCNTEIASHSLTTATSTAASLPAPSVTPTALTLSEAGGTGTYTIVLGSEPTGDVTVTVSSSDSTAATVAPTSLTFTPSNYSDRQTVTVSGVDDDVVNNPLRTATVSHSISGGGYDNVAVGSVTVTLKDDDDAASKEKEATQAAERVDNATLAEVVKQAAGATSTAITNRLSSIASVAVGGAQPLDPTSPTDPASPAGNGGSGDDAASLLESLTTDAAQFLWSRQGAIQRGDLQLQQALAGRRFAIPLSALSQSSASGAQGGFATSTLSLWGSADYTSYENILDGVDLDGDVFLVAVGLDMQPRADLVTGLAVAINSSDFDYTYNAVDNQSVGTEEAKGTYEVSITTVNPYVSWSASEHLDVWASVGYGRGERQLKPKGGTTTSKQSDWLSLAGGARFQLWEGEIGMDTGADAAMGGVMDAGTMRVGSPFSLLLKVEGATARFMGVDVQQARLATEASRRFPMEAGVLTTAVELGLRLRSEEAAGVELGGSLNWLHERTGVSTTAHGRVLLAGGDHKEWGVGGRLRYRPVDSGEGINLVLEPSIGETGSRLADLWSLDGSDLAFNSDEPAAQLRGEMSYGVLYGAGMLTPYSALSLSQGGSSTIGLGLRYRLPSSLELDLRGERECCTVNGRADHRIGLQLQTSL